MATAQFPDYAPSLGKLVPFCGACCVICSFNCAYPECVGCFVEDSLCCCHNQVMCFKLTRETFFDCIWCRSNCATGPCGACIGSNCQLCCLDIRCSLPTGPKNPLLLNVLGVTVNLKCQSVCRFCSSLETLYADIHEELPQSGVELQPVANSAATPGAAPHSKAAQYERERRHERKANDMDAIMATLVSDPSQRSEASPLERGMSTQSDFYRVDTDTHDH